MKALVLDGKVVDLHAEGFPVAPPLAWHDCPDETRHGWLHDGKRFTAPAERVPTYIEKRRAEYPPTGDQLDVIWKAFDYLNNNGVALPSEAIDMLDNQILAVKERHPKDA